MKFLETGKLKSDFLEDLLGKIEIDDPRVVVGLGAAATVRRVRVIWPSGRVEDWTDVAVDRWLTLEEGTGQRHE